jgi:peptidoglycan/xylan/chitin deacetylase (PgdA/CDA1 family)
MKRTKKARRWLLFVGLAVAWGGSGIATWLTVPRATAGDLGANDMPPSLRQSYAAAAKGVADLDGEQQHDHSVVVSQNEVDLSRIQVDMASGHYREAMMGIRNLDQSVANWKLELQGGSVLTPDEVDSSTAGGLLLPILIYHYTPPDFADQLQHLKDTGYSVIDMDQALAGMRGGTLPMKPVVITFDDGFENQMQAFDILKQFNMKATFYIIDGGQASNWCIGAGRKYHLPSQPPGGCGDKYLTWDQVRELDRSGLITIGGHTIDHPNLASETPAEQKHEIIDGKTELERQLGHKIYHFAYPYGAYDATTVLLVQEAGYQTAVTTHDGNNQDAGTEYILNRVRNAFDLP